MAESMSLLDGCRESILKLAATQPSDGKRAILVLAEIFQANAGSASPDGQRGQSQGFVATDRRPKPSRRAARNHRGVFRAARAAGPITLQNIDPKDDIFDPAAFREALVRLIS